MRNSIQVLLYLNLPKFSALKFQSFGLKCTFFKIHIVDIYYRNKNISVNLHKTINGGHLNKAQQRHYNIYSRTNIVISTISYSNNDAIKTMRNFLDIGDSCMLIVTRRRPLLIFNSRFGNIQDEAFRHVPRSM